MAIYLKLGQLAGNVNASGYVGQIEIESFSYGYEVKVDTTVGTSANRLSSGRLQPHDMHLFKKMDPSTTMFMWLGLQGKNLGTSVLTVTIPDASSGAGAAPVGGATSMDAPYMVYTMTDTICTGYTNSGSQSGGVPMDSISLNFSSVQFRQISRDASNNPMTPVTQTFNYTTNTGT